MNIKQHHVVQGYLAGEMQHDILHNFPQPTPNTNTEVLFISSPYYQNKLCVDQFVAGNTPVIIYIMSFIEIQYIFSVANSFYIKSYLEFGSSLPWRLGSQ